MNQFYTPTDHFSLLPALLLALFGCAILMLDFFVLPHPRQKRWLIFFALLGEFFAGLALYRQYRFLEDQSIPALRAFSDGLIIDGFSIFFNAIFVAAAVLVAIISYRYLEVEGEHHGEFYGLILLAQCGMYFLASGTELVTIFIGIELMAVTFYILVGFLRSDRRSNEAAMKYLLLGAFSSGFLAYGFSLLYAITGSTRLPKIAAELAQRPATDPLLLLAIVTTLVGLLFKVGAAPFHMWAPDAYEGAPTPVTAYLSVASKAASVAVLVRLFLGTLAPHRINWEPMLAVAVVLSLTIGNFSALSQTNLKRLLAFSSISHAGYILLGLIAGNRTGLTGICIYLFVYTFMNTGAFLVLISLRQKGMTGDDIDDLNGLIHRSPGHALLMALFLLSLGGIPPTAGFIAKYYIFLSLVETGHYALAITAALFVAVSIYYYFRIVRAMFLNEAGQLLPALPGWGARVGFAVTALATLAIGLYPEPIIRFAGTSLLR
ncbi:MAG: NADH-quinone oxidoreductase subunit N [Acidobacteria bacterium]|nr:NADH-quinone oxidoreductase subunit N [Acidobacteriota bacterium]